MAIDERPTLLREYIINIINKWILEGRLKPGQRISPTAIANELQISHIPVREALRTLEGEGIVRNVGRRGFFLPELSLHVAEDIFYWRSVLEHEAYRIGVPLLTDEDIDTLRSLTDKMVKASEMGDNYSFGVLNRQFHFVPFYRIGSETLLKMLNLLWDQASLYISTHLFTYAKYPYIQVQHDLLLKAFIARDADRANELMIEHRDITLGVIKTILVQTSRGEEANKISRVDKLKTGAFGDGSK